MAIKQDLVAAIGEFTGTTLFLLLALGGAKTAQFTRTSSQTEGLETALGNQTIIFIAVSFGLSLLSTAWVFYRVTGGLFNPAITLALYLIGGLGWLRAVMLFVSQILGGIAGAALVAALTPFGGSGSVTTTLDARVNIPQGLFIEAFLTAILVLTVLLLAAEKHRSTHLAPLGIGITLLACHLFGVVWTGCGINPARSFGPSVVSGDFPGYHWIYWVGPFLGSLMAVGFYLMLKAFEYTSVVFGQDADHEDENAKRHVVGHTLFRRARGKLVVYHPKSGQQSATVAVFDAQDKVMQEAIRAGQASVVDLPSSIEQRGEAGAGSSDTMHMMETGTLPASVQNEAQATAPNAAPLGGLSNGVPSMRAEAQDVGALQVPGTVGSGLANIPIVENIINQ